MRHRERHASEFARTEPIRTHQSQLARTRANSHARRAPLLEPRIRAFAGAGVPQVD